MQMGALDLRALAPTFAQISSKRVRLVNHLENSFEHTAPSKGLRCSVRRFHFERYPTRWNFGKIYQREDFLAPLDVSGYIIYTFVWQEGITVADVLAEFKLRPAET